jgi:hypothetical protein
MATERNSAPGLAPASNGTPTPPEFSPQPTWHGRRFLRYLCLAKWLLRQPYAGDAIEQRAEKKVAAYHAELTRLAGEILARPVASANDMVDRLIVVAHESDPAWEINRDTFEAALAGALACAGINVGDCRLNREAV